MLCEPDLDLRRWPRPPLIPPVTMETSVKTETGVSVSMGLSYSSQSAATASSREEPRVEASEAARGPALYTKR